MAREGKINISMSPLKPIQQKTLDLLIPCAIQAEQRTGFSAEVICAAFAVTGPGGVRLLTAAHCLRGAMPGQTLAYATREQWEATASAYSRARIVSVDKGADRAALAPERGLDTLEQSPRARAFGPHRSLEAL